jgi:hypothetical protein
MSRERRQDARIQSKVPLDLYDLKGRMVVGEAQCVNMSQTGAQLKSRTPLKRQAKVRLHVAAGKTSPLQLAGKVVWSKRLARGFAYGIEFLRSWTPKPATN